MVGDLTAMIPGVPPLGGVADAVLKPIYSDVLLAFGNWHNVTRAQRLGFSHYQERFQEGADRAYTLAWLIAMRTGMFESREQTSCTITVADGAPWRIGQRGFGHFFIGDRIGFTCLGAKLGRIYVERVSEISIAWGRDSAPVWKIQIGQSQAEDPLVRAYEDFQDFLGLLKDLGVG